MNREVYEINNNNCAVMEDNGRIRLLNKNNNNVSFDDLLVLENDEELYINEKKSKQQKIDQLTGWDANKKVFMASGYLGVILGLSVALGSLLTAGIHNIGILYCGLFGLIVGSLGGLCVTLPDRIEELATRRQLKKDIVYIDSKINELDKEIRKIKNDVKEETILSKPILSDWSTTQYVSIISNNPQTEKSISDRNYRILRSYLSDYYTDDELEQEKGKQYTLKRPYHH